MEALEEALESTVVVEHESGGGGGTFEVGTADVGSPRFDRLVKRAKTEADAIARDGGGWAAVRTDFGDAGTISHEAGWTIYAVRGG